MMGLEPLLRALPRTLGEEQTRLVERAYTVAAYWHRDQKRKSGDPYITHPVAVATTLAELGEDHEMLCAALLHDVLEDTDCPRAALEREFGESITGLLTTLVEVEAAGGWASCADERVLTLKLADRLHNQRTIRFVEPDKQLRKSQETLDFFVPLAGRMGMDRLRFELETHAKAHLPMADRAGVDPSFRALSAGALLLPRRERARWLEEWLHDLQALPDRRARLRFSAQLLAGMPRMAVTLRNMPTGPLVAPFRGLVTGVPRAVRWVLRSDVRVWALLAPLVFWMTVQAASSGMGEAVVVLITVPPALAAGVEALRERLGVAEDP